MVVFSGDGDLVAIGGNHFIHAARRNIDLTVICVNNFIYGMTGGQVAPDDARRRKTSTTPFGNFEPPFNLPYLARAAARSTSPAGPALARAAADRAIDRGAAASRASASSRSSRPARRSTRARTGWAPASTC